MQERWNLIQSGISEKSIRINSLYVSNKLHGRVSKSKFEHASDTPDLSQPDSPRPTSPIVHHDPQPLHVHTSPSDEPAISLVSNTCLLVVLTPGLPRLHHLLSPLLQTPPLSHD